ncbi:thiamine-phosphate kinase [Sphingomonas lutea]|uniref:thiamine-phosphate kinase n=1 Tax=Sphingomonas lutea TaxID=1045317 RepID=UPI001F3E4A4F|nr:thiamine-phosphate kinase [Sphingomonas lutea]
MKEADVIARLRRSATHPAARDLLDDAAVLDGFVITHDSIAEGVHFLPFDPPASIGWKLVAANLSDLAAKGATPAGALLSFTLSDDDDWDEEFLGGVEAACESYHLPLIGGDTIALPRSAPRIFGMTAIGRSGAPVPSRAGGQAGDALWVVGTLGDAAAGLAQLREDGKAVGPLVDVYRRPVPLLAAGSALAAYAHAMMDVSDGLLLDARRMAEASGCGVEIALDAVPISSAFVRTRGDSQAARMFAATGGDDYALLAALPPDLDPTSLASAGASAVTRLGRLAAGPPGLRLTFGGAPIPLPERLGYQHGR